MTVLIGYIDYLYDKGFYANIATIDTAKCTHLILSSLITNAGADAVEPPGAAPTFAAVRAGMVSLAHAAGQKLLVNIFGNDVSYPQLAVVMADAGLRDTLANNLVAYCVANNIDGVTVDWEETWGFNNATHQAEVSAFVTTLGQLLHAAGKILTVFSAWQLKSDGTWDPFFEISTGAAAFVDYIMCSRYRAAVSDVSTTLNAWVSAGYSKSKLTFGTSFLGYKTATDAEIIAYKDLITIIANPNANTQNALFIPAALATDGVGGTFDVYWNGPNNMLAIAQYVKANSFNGMFTWELYLDAAKGDSNALTTQLYNGLFPSTPSTPIVPSVNVKKNRLPMGLEILAMQKAIESMEPYQRGDCPIDGFPLETAVDGIIHCRSCGWTDQRADNRDLEKV